jgi:hypothetical protein
MSGVDEAASAFQAVISPRAQEVPTDKPANRETLNAEPMFENLNSGAFGDEPAGGDSDPDPEVVERPTKAKRQRDEESEGPEDEDDEDEDDEDDEEEDTDEEDEEDDEEEEDEEANRELDLDKKVKIKVDGEQVEVPLKEALAGYIRVETFNRRMNSLKEIAGSVEQEAVKVANNRDKYSELLNTLTEQLDSLVPKEPDWDALALSDPQAAFRQKLQWDKYKEQRAALDQEKRRVDVEKNAEATENLKKYVVGERNKMLAAVPEWTNPKIREKDQERMSKVARKVGFTNDEISTVYDHRMMRVLLMAAKYDRLMSRKPQPITTHSRLTKHGSANTRTVPKADVGAQKRLSETGSVDAAAQVFGGILAAEKRQKRK